MYGGVGFRPHHNKSHKRRKVALHMTLQTLVVTLEKDAHKLAEKMNIQTDAVFGSQCDKDAYDEFEYNGNTMQVISSSTRGVGINRNQVLMRATADVCILADDDMTFLDGYMETARYWFEKLPQADILVFNLQEEKPRRYKNTKVRRIHALNYSRYGAARLALRRERVCFSGVMFHTMFGGGCQYSCGEDTLFLRECLRKGLRIVGVPATLAKIHDGDSTWFQGYTDKYFFDKGILYYALDRHFSKVYTLIHGFRYRKKYSAYGWRKAVKQMWKGIDSVK